MLTLTRKVGESLKVGDDVEVVVREIRRNQVRLGIIAPDDVRILRAELLERAVSNDSSGVWANYDDDE